jgi:hypothetical protein
MGTGLEDVMGRRAILILIVVATFSPVDHVSSQERWELGETSWRVGGELDAVQFFRIAGVALLRTAAIAVANAGNHEIVTLDTQGRVLWRQGRQGRGPGEYESIDAVTAYRGDSVAVLDARLRRITVLDSRGAYGRSINLPRLPPGTSFTGLHHGAEGTFIVGTVRGRMPGDPPGLIRNPGALVSIGARGEYIGVVAEVQGDEWFATRDSRMLGLLPLGKVTRYVVDGTRIVIADGTSTSVREINLPTGAERQLTIAGLRQRPVTATHIRDVTTTALDDAPAGARQMLAATYREVPFPSRLPTTMNIALASDGAVWVQEYCEPGARSTRWHIVSRGGSYIATVSVPCSTRILAVHGNAAFVLDTDALDSQTIAHMAVRRQTG